MPAARHEMEKRRPGPQSWSRPAGAKQLFRETAARLGAMPAAPQPETEQAK